MKLQISFDITDLDKALEIGKSVTQFAPIFEIGSLLLYKYGLQAVEKFRQAFPEKTLLADTKILDRGIDAVKLMASAQPDWLTVMAGTSHEVIHSVCTTAHEKNMKVMLDLLDASSLGQAALEAKSLGVDAVLFHKPYDQKDALLFLDSWDLVRGNTDLPVFVSGTFTQDTIDRVIDVQPDGIVIGKAITDADDPAKLAEFFSTKMAQD